MRHNMICYAMLCHAMLCYARICCAELCYAIPWTSPSPCSGPIFLRWKIRKKGEGRSKQLTHLQHFIFSGKPHPKWHSGMPHATWHSGMPDATWHSGMPHAKLHSGWLRRQWHARTPHEAWRPGTPHAKWHSGTPHAKSHFLTIKNLQKRNEEVNARTPLQQLILPEQIGQEGRESQLMLCFATIRDAMPCDLVVEKAETIKDFGMNIDMSRLKKITRTHKFAMLCYATSWYAISYDLVLCSRS